MTGLIHFHAPHTRSFSTLVLLEELGVECDRQVLSMEREEHLAPAYRAVNPMGKVPAIKHGDAVITEQVAIALYLADLFPEKGLAPAITDPLRGPYLRWMVFYAACFEPAVVDRALQRDPGKRAMSPYGDYDTVLDAVSAQLATGQWLLGERFTAADVIWGTALQWTTQFKIVSATPEIAAYIARFAARPAIARAQAKDAALLDQKS
jgi:glutathione S-transferase